MSTPSNATPITATPASTKTRPWPDMSAYGIHFGVLVLGNGEKRLVMVDKDACWGHLATAMGFSQSRWLGLYVKSSLNLNIPGFKANFPAARVVQMTEQQLASSISDLVLERRNYRLSQMHKGAGRMSWRPTGEPQRPTSLSENNAEEAPKPGSARDVEGADGPEQLSLSPVEPGDASQETITTAAVIRQTIRLGTNSLGQRVFESGDGTRFCRSADSAQVLAKETVGQAPSPVFLRVGSDQDLIEIAAGLVLEMESQHLRSEDFLRYLEAIHGPDADTDQEKVADFQKAIDLAISRSIESQPGGSAAQFHLAKRLHEARPSFWRPDFELATPSPLWVAIESVLSEAKSDLASSRCIDASDGAQVAAIRGFDRADTGSIAEHQVLVARLRTGPLGSGADEVVRAGIRVTQADHEAIVHALQARAQDGNSVFILDSPKTGVLTDADRKFIASLASKYSVKGLFDIASPMVGPGATHGLRILNVGERVDSAATPIVAKRIPTLFSYDDLWERKDTFFGQASAITTNFEVDDRSDNVWQAPYVPYSQISEPVSMCPRNLLAPIRDSLARLVDKHGMGIDDYVATKMGWSIAKMEEIGFDPEQVDALAFCIDSIDDGEAFLEADATGIGKGRVLAATALYARRQGLNVIFVTENTDLFSDFYRDVGHIDAMDDLSRPFIVNSGHVIESFDSKEPIAKALSNTTSMLTYAQGKFPKEGLALATYSQFNREVESKIGGHKVTAWANAIEALDTGSSTFDVIRDIASTLDLPTYSAVEFKGTTGIVDAATALEYHRDELSKAKAAVAGEKPTRSEAFEIKRHETAIKLITGSNLELRSHLLMALEEGITPAQLKQHWIRSNALAGSVVLIDESHNAAGPDSNIGANFRSAISKARSVVYASATAIKDDANLGLYQPLFPPTVNASNLHSVLRRGGEPLREIICAMLAKDGRMIRREHDLSRVEFRLHVDVERKARNEEWSDAFAGVLSDMQRLSSSSTAATQAAMAERLRAANAIKSGGGYSPTMDHDEEALDARNTAAGRDQDGLTDESGDPSIEQSQMEFDAGTSAAGTAGTLTGAETTDDPAQANPAVTRKSAALPRFPSLVAKGDPLIDAAKEAGITLRTIEVGNTNFSSRLYNVARSFMAALNADHACDKAITALNEGRKPVVTVENTMETVLNELIGDQEFVIGRIELGRKVGFKDLFVRYVESCLVGTLAVKQGKRVIRRETSPITDPTVLALADALRKKIMDLPDIPLSPIDVVRDRLTQAGYSVDEISGRKIRLGTNADGTNYIEKLGKRLKSDLRRRFNSGQLSAVILSLSGSTGISLHASRDVLDQSQRELVELQPAKGVDRRLQFWGRVNRRGQVSSPIIDLLSSGIPSEIRLTVMQNASLRRLSANISGNADNQAIDQSAPDILNKVGNEVCYRWFESNPVLAARLGYQAGSTEDMRESFSSTKFVDMLTGRMMFLTVAEQRRVYEEINAEFQAFIDECEMNGFNPLKSKELDVRAKTEGVILFQAAQDNQSAFDGPVHAKALSFAREVPAVDCDAMWVEVDKNFQAIVDAYGATPCTTLCQRLQTEVEAMAPLLVPPGMSTVIEAMHAKEANPVITAFTRLEMMKEWIPSIMPGSIIHYESKSKVDSSADALDKQKDKDGWGFAGRGLVVTSLSIPNDNLLAYARWVVEGYDLESHKRVSVRLSSLFAGNLWPKFPAIGLRLPNDNAKAATKCVESVTSYFAASEWKSLVSENGVKRIESTKSGIRWLQAKPDDFDADGLKGLESMARASIKKKLEYNTVQHFERVVLTGNLFRAAEASFTLKAGTICSYSDDKGQWSHGILMPEGTTLRNVLDTPVPLSDPTQVLGLIKALEAGRYQSDYLYLTDSDSFEKRKAIVRVRRADDGWRYSVDFNGLKRNERSILQSYDSLQDLAAVKKSKGNKTAVTEAAMFPIEHLTKVLPDLIEGMAKIGAPLLVPGNFRSLLNQYMQDEIESRANSQIANSLKAQDTRDATLSALLDSDADEAPSKPALRLSA